MSNEGGGHTRSVGTSIILLFEKELRDATVLSQPRRYDLDHRSQSTIPVTSFRWCALGGIERCTFSALVFGTVP